MQSTEPESAQGEPEPAPSEPAAESPLGAQLDAGDAFSDRPELFVGAAFAGGLALAMILRRFGR